MTESLRNAAAAGRGWLQVELAKCSRAELIALLQRHGFSVRPGDVRRARAEALMARGRAMTDRAISIMEEVQGRMDKESRDRWFHAGRLFDRSMAMRERAGRMMWRADERGSVDVPVL